ncbi:MAG: transposase [Thermoplasmata archaeon]|nr:MAG: transposase [Thermoplasmata archaeon]
MKSKSFKNQTKKPVGLMYDHMIFHTKYNRKVLVDKIRRRCEEIIRYVLTDIDCECVEINVQPNHVHLLGRNPIYEDAIQCCHEGKRCFFLPASQGIP